MRFHRHVTWRIWLNWRASQGSDSGTHVCRYVCRYQTLDGLVGSGDRTNLWRQSKELDKLTVQEEAAVRTRRGRGGGSVDTKALRGGGGGEIARGSQSAGLSASHTLLPAQPRSAVPCGRDLWSGFEPATATGGIATRSAATTENATTLAVQVKLMHGLRRRRAVGRPEESAIFFFRNEPRDCFFLAGPPLTDRQLWRAAKNGFCGAGASAVSPPHSLSASIALAVRHSPPGTTPLETVPGGAPSWEEGRCFERGSASWRWLGSSAQKAVSEAR